MFLWNSHILKSVTSPEALVHNGSYSYVYLFLILSTIKIKFGQILMCCMANISNMFSAQYWRLDTKSRPFYDYIKTEIQRDLVIFNWWRLPFLIVPFSSFQKGEALESWRNWLLSIWSRLLNWKELSPSPPNCSKDSWKELPLLISISWPSMVTFWVVVQTIYSKMHPISCKQKIQVIRFKQVYFSSSNVSTDITVIVKD